MEGYDLSLADRDDPVYCKLGPIHFDLGKGSQQVTLARRTIFGEMHKLPLFSKDFRVPEKLSKKYTCCSYRQLYEHVLGRPPLDRVFYELIAHDSPCHFYIDVDFKFSDLRDGARRPHVEDAMSAFMGLLNEARAKIWVQSEDEAWNFVWDEIVTTKLFANSAVKDSQHIILHLPGLRMLKNGHEHLKRWAQVALQLGVDKYGNNENNPLMYGHVDGTMHSLVDVSVYTPNRLFRLLGNAKLKMTDEEMGGYLWPACKHLKTISCEDAGCMYRVLNIFSEYDFLSNLASFIPLKADGSPQQPMLMLVPDDFDPDLENSRTKRWSTLGPRSGNSRNASPISANMSFSRLFANDNSNHGSSSVASLASGSSSSSSSSSASGEPPRHIFEKIAILLTRQTGHLCTYLYQNKHGIEVFKSDSKECVLKFEKTGNATHKNNHITITCKLAMPYPTFNIVCRDPDCLRETEYDPRMTAAQKERVRRVPLVADPAVFEPIKAMLAEYVLSQAVTADMFMMGFQ